MSLPADGPHQDKPIAVRDERLSAVVGPSEVAHLERNRIREWKSVKLPCSMSTVTHTGIRKTCNPRCASYLCSAVINQLHRPTTFVLNPNKYPSIRVASGQFLEGFVPSHQDHLKGVRKRHEPRTELAGLAYSRPHLEFNCSVCVKVVLITHQMLPQQKSGH